jgi:addiction module HigA family antidote
MLPTHRAPTHPGEILREEFRLPLKLTQSLVADKLHVSFKTVNAIENGRQSITTEMAVRLGILFSTTADLWINLQKTYDLWEVENGKHAKEIHKIRPLRQMVAG